MSKILVVGAGFSGVTIARLLSESGYKVHVVERGIMLRVMPSIILMSLVFVCINMALICFTLPTKMFFLGSVIFVNGCLIGIK